MFPKIEFPGFHSAKLSLDDRRAGSGEPNILKRILEKPRSRPLFTVTKQVLVVRF
jgi:hypothetical protein